MKKEQLHLGILHYHLRFCGVRTVISASLRSLIGFGNVSSLHIDLIASDARQTPGITLLNELHEWTKYYPNVQVTLQAIQIPELAYNEIPAKDRDHLFRDADKLCHRILESLSIQRCSMEIPYILHAHNLTLGKNPRLTLALKYAADRLKRDHLPAKKLNQIHDFAEDKRPERWAALCNCSGRNDPSLAVEMMYPASENIHWVCLNSSDRRRLLTIGLPPHRVDLLPNPIDDQAYRLSQNPERKAPAHPAVNGYQDDLKQRISDYAQKNGFRFEANRKILLSPVKAIRRKNIAESILLLMDRNDKEDRYQLLITLKAQSREDVAYCTALEQFVKDTRLPVVIGFGSELLSSSPQRKIHDGQIEKYCLADVAAISEAVVTTSIQEGFGYVFHEPWLLRKAVLGRNLPSLTADFTAEGMNLDHLYTHLLIPQSWLEKKEDDLYKAYYEKYSLLRNAAHLDICSYKEFQIQWNKTKIHPLVDTSGSTENRIDWADLDLELQLDILHKIHRSPELIRQLVFTSGDRSKIECWYPTDLSAIMEQNRSIVEQHYGLAHYAQRFKQIIHRTATAGQDPTDSPVRPDNTALLDEFSSVENLRLLM